MHGMPEDFGLQGPDAAGKREGQKGEGDGGEEMLRISFPEIEKGKDAEMNGKNGKKGFDPEERHDG
jgi:hypothetical protein